LKKLDSSSSKYRELPLRLEKAEILLSGFDDIQSQIKRFDLDIDERTIFKDTYYTLITLRREVKLIRLSPSRKIAPLVATGIIPIGY